MKSRSSLLLMEQLIMVLVFALAAAICLQIFVKAAGISQETAKRDEAVVLAQNTAELLKASKGETELVQAMNKTPYQLQISAQTSPWPDFVQIRIEVYDQQTLLYALNTGWQEVASS